MVLTAAQRAKAWRESKKVSIGAEAWKTQERDRKRKSRALAKQRKNQSQINLTLEQKDQPEQSLSTINFNTYTLKSPITEVEAYIQERLDLIKKLQDEIDAVKTKTDISEFNTEDLTEYIFQKKKAHLATLKPPRTIAKETVIQQLTKVINIYKRMFNIKSVLIPNLNFKFLKATDKVIHFINENWKTDNSRNAQIQAISSITWALNGYEDEYKFYSKYSTDKRKEINKMASDNKMTDKEKINMPQWNDIKELYKKIEDKQDKALIAIYTLLPPRRVADIGLLTLTYKTPTSDNLNWLLLNKDPENNSGTLIYQKYKTFKIYGKIEVEIPPQLTKILKDYIDTYQIQEGKPMFPTLTGQYYKNFSEVVSDTFKKHTKKNISVNTLRHSFITEFLNKKRSIAEKKQLALLMGHSVADQGKYDRIKSTEVYRR
jgi:hypothetical protein